jgi:hypothetical protein
MPNGGRLANFAARGPCRVSLQSSSTKGNGRHVGSLYGRELSAAEVSLIGGDGAAGRLIGAGAAPAGMSIFFAVGSSPLAER